MQIFSILGCFSAATMLIAASDRMTVVTESSCGGNQAFVMQTGPAGAGDHSQIVRKARGHVHIERRDGFNSSVIDQSAGTRSDDVGQPKSDSGCS